MSLQDIREILLKANADVNVRRALLENPDEFFKNYNLTEEEKQCLRELKTEDQFSYAAEQAQPKEGSLMSDIRI